MATEIQNQNGKTKSNSNRIGAKVLKYLLKKKTDQFFAFLRFFRPIFSIPNGPVIVTRFNDVQEVLSRPEIFTVQGYAPMMDPVFGPYMLARDGTTYNQRDKGIMRAMLQREDLPKVRTTVAELTKAAISDGTRNGILEVVSNISRKVPIQLTGKHFGFPGPDLESMFRWSRATQYDMFHNQDRSDAVHQDNLNDEEMCVTNKV